MIFVGNPYYKPSLSTVNGRSPHPAMFDVLQLGHGAKLMDPPRAVEKWNATICFPSLHLLPVIWSPYLKSSWYMGMAPKSWLPNSLAIGMQWLHSPKKTWSLGLVSTSPNRHTLPKVFEPSRDHAPSRYGVATSATSGTSGRLHCAWLVKQQCPMNPQPHATIMYYHVMFQKNWINSPLYARIFRLM